jgi:hypothetical protein
MMAGNKEIHLGPIFADESPPNDASPGDGGGPVNSLHLTGETAFNVGDKNRVDPV